jgi:hypothetical protein
MEPLLSTLIFMVGLMGLIILGIRYSVYFYRHGALRPAASWRYSEYTTAEEMEE